MYTASNLFGSYQTEIESRTFTGNHLFMVDDGNMYTNAIITQVTQISILHMHVLYMYWNQCIYCLRLNVKIACLFKKFNRDLELLTVDTGARCVRKKNISC